jgi:uncharacterized protein
LVFVLKNVILNQKDELERIFAEKYIERETKPFSLENNLIKVIIGPRRAGKSFFVVHALKQKKSFGYANFDNEELAQAKDYDEIISEINQVYGKQKVLFFDEIQNLPNWELFVNRLQRQGYNVIVTGSNSHLLSKELATHLTGRHLPTNVLPFSFQEYIKAKEIDPKKVTTTRLKEAFFAYLQNGGYPETILKNLEPKQYLSVLFDSIIYNDIIRRYNIRKSGEIEKLSFFMLSNVATEFSYSSLAKATNIKSSITSQKYERYLEDAYLFFTIPRFSYKTKEIVQSKKMYCYDNGLIQAKAFQTSQNLGKLFENLVAIHLKKMEIEKELELYCWRNQQREEVDFVIKKGTKITQLIQACYDPTNPETKKREIRALINASQNTKCKDLLIITNDYESIEEHEWFGNKAKIRFIPAWKWLLKKEKN